MLEREYAQTCIPTLRSRDVSLSWRLTCCYYSRGWVARPSHNALWRPMRRGYGRSRQLRASSDVWGPCAPPTGLYGRVETGLI